MSLQSEIKALCKENFPDIVRIRRDIHQHPEIGFEVTRTANIAASELKKLGLTVKTGIGKTGVVGDLEIPGATKRIALRADMDALPMQEMSDLPYKSLFDGKAHMCGHDSHTAMLIGAARVICRLKEHLSVNVRFIFQPNEENLPGGAPAMIADGALDDVDEIFGLHVWPLSDIGKFSICEGPALGQPDVFRITITGKGGHAAVPQGTIDPIVIGAQFVNAAQSIISRNTDPLDSAVVSITEFHGGSTHNVIPQTISITGTVRTFRKPVQEMIRERLENLLAGICQSHGASSTFDYEVGYPVTFNHPESVQRSRTATAEIAGEENVIYPETPVLGGEDFAFYTEKIPGCFIFLGIHNPAKDVIYMCHDPRFRIDEDAMIDGMALHTTLVLSY